MWSGSWSVATTLFGFWTWIWSTRHCGLGKKWLVDFNAGKTQLILFDQSKNSGSFDVKMDGSVLEGKSSFTKLGLTFSSRLDRGSYNISIAKTTSKKCVIWSFFPLRLLCISINLPYAYVWNTVVTPGWC